VPILTKDRKEAIALHRKSDEERTDGRPEQLDEARDRDIRDHRAATQQHDVVDTVRMVLGEAERPDVTDRPADHVDPVDAEPIEQLGDQVCDVGTIAAAWILDWRAESPPGTIKDETPVPGHAGDE
jgi:hypothetical protein